MAEIGTIKKRNCLRDVTREGKKHNNSAAKIIGFLFKWRVETIKRK